MKSQTIVFKKEELVKDIRDRAFVMARSFADKTDDDKDDAWLMDVAQPQWPDSMYHEIAGRLMTLAFHECEVYVKPLVTKMAQDGFVGSDKFHDTCEYKLFLSVDDDTIHGQVKLLRDLIHEFIVYRVLLGWCELVSRDHMGVLADRLSRITDDLKGRAYSMGKAGERPYFPF